MITKLHRQYPACMDAYVASLGVLVLAACGQSSGSGRASPRVDSATATAADAGPAVVDASRLPEDEQAGLRAQAQWREHLAFEEEERQLMFDRQRLKAHAAVIALARRARARYDAARDAAAVMSAQRAMSRSLRELRGQVKRLDPWGVNSRLLEDYAWFAATLEGPYADAKRAALEGRGERLTQLAAEFDVHMVTIAAWLRKAAESEEESEEEHQQEQREREANSVDDGG